MGGRNETDKRETRPPPVRTGDAFWDGCARSDGHMLRFMRLRAACHEPRFMRSCAAAHATFAACHARRAAAHAVSRCCFDDRAARFLRLCAAAIFRGRNETDKRETRPSPVRAGGARFGTGARPAGRSHAAVHALTCRLPRAAVHAVMRCGSRARAALDMRPRLPRRRSCGAVLAIARCGSCWRKERNGQTGNAPPPVRAGARVLGRGRAAAGLFLRRGWGGASGRVLPNFCAVDRIVRGNVTGGAMGARRAACD